MEKLKYNYIQVKKNNPFSEPPMGFDLICNKTNIKEQEEDLKKVGLKFININDYIEVYAKKEEK